MATITGIATSDSNFSTLVSVLQYIDSNVPGSNLVDTLNNPGTYTVFAPTNSAFAKLAQDLGYAGDANDEAAVINFLVGLGAPTLQQVVLYHVTGSVFTAADVASGTSITTLQGGAIDTTELPTLGDLEPDFIDPSLTATDIGADNGVVHVIDRVLLPIDLPGNDAPTIAEVLASSGTGFDDNGSDFDMLRQAVDVAGLTDALNDPNADYTVFAPTDDAFVGLSQTLGYSGSDESGAFDYLVDALRLLNNGDDPVQLLTAVLKNHAAPTSLQASQVVAQGSVTTFAGAELTLDGLSIVDSDPDLPNPNLIGTDLQAANGVVHTIDGILFPVDLLQSDGSNDVDFVIADDSNNFISTGNDNDLIDAKGNDDFVNAGNGNDVVLGGAGNDVALGGNGDDLIKGEDGNDKLLGNDGNDVIQGGAGTDYILGGSGNDTITGGAGNDFIAAGSGENTFVYSAGDGNDFIYGFQDGLDKIDVSAFGFSSFSDIEGSISEGFISTSIDFGDTELTLVGVRASNLDADDFIIS